MPKPVKPVKSAKPVKSTKPVKSAVVRREYASGNDWIVYDGKAHLCRVSPYVKSRNGDGPIYGYRVKSACDVEVEAPVGYKTDMTDEYVRAPLCETCVAQATVGDFLLRIRTSEDRRYRIPMLVVDGCGCGGHVAFCFGLGSVMRGDIALQLALIQYGTTMANWDNGPPTHACDCDKRLAEINTKVKALPVIEDGGWKGRSGGRCITDYTREVKFSRDLTEAELDLWIEHLRRKDCPGWTGVGCRRCDEGRYVFTTTMDSSD
jgi:hypothetical protein